MAMVHACLLMFSVIFSSYDNGSCLSVYTVRPNTVAGEAGHVRLERPIDSSSDKTVCAPKVAEKGTYSRDLINKPLADPDFCSCCQHVLLFSRGIWEIHAEFLAFFLQNLQIISHNLCH